MQRCFAVVMFDQFLDFHHHEIALHDHIHVFQQRMAIYAQH